MVSRYDVLTNTWLVGFYRGSAFVVMAHVANV